jgi:hypothetical protein
MADVTVQQGDFCCVPIRGEGGALIRLGEFLNGDSFIAYQHAEIYIGTTESVAARYPSDARTAVYVRSVPAPFGWTFGAYPGGARLVPLPCSPAELPGALWSSDAFTLSDTDRQLIVARALSYQGTPYGFTDYAALALHHFDVNAKSLQRFISSTNSMICSQLCDKMYQLAGIQLFSDGRWNGYVTPADLAALIISHLEGGVTTGSRM